MAEPLIIEERGRRPLALRWRDRLLVVLLGLIWARPVWAVARRAGAGVAVLGGGGDAAFGSPRTEMFVADLTRTACVACCAVVLIVAVGTYRWWRDRREGFGEIAFPEALRRPALAAGDDV